MTTSSLRSLAIGLLLICLALPMGAQTDLRFDHLTMDDGLSESIVLSIAQDPDGYAWFGTADGLNRYDGASIRTFHGDPSDSTTLSHNYVQRLFVDRRGRLWAASLGGLDLYDPAHESFHRVALLGNRATVAVYGIAESPRDSALWLATDAGLFEYHPDRGVTRRFRAEPESSTGLRVANMTCCSFDRDGRLWIGSRDNGLDLFDPATEKARHFARSDQGLSSNFIQVVHQDRNGVFWIGTEGGGLDRFDAATGTFRQYKNVPGALGSLGHNTVRSILEDRDGRLWIATDGGGIARYDTATDAFLHVRHEPLRTTSLANDRITALFQDRAGALWAGTWGNGVDRWSPSKDKFRNDPRLKPLVDALPSTFIISLFEDSRGTLWVGTHGGGFLVYLLGLRPAIQVLVHRGQPQQRIGVARVERDQRAAAVAKQRLDQRLQLDCRSQHP